MPTATEMQEIKEGFESQQIIINTDNEEGEIFISLDRPKIIDESLTSTDGPDSNDPNEINDPKQYYQFYPVGPGDLV